MAKSVKKGKQRFWLDPQGNEIPYSYIKKEDRRRDKAVTRVMSRVEKLHDIVKREKAEIQKIMGEYLNSVAGEYGEKWKGNATVKDFSDQYKVEINVAERIEFDERLQVAKEKIDKCIENWSKGTSRKIKLLIDRAFKTDKKGKLNNNMLLGLRQLDIQDELWEEAMEIISKSVVVVNSTEYYRFFVKKKNAFEPLELNFSSIETGDTAE